MKYKTKIDQWIKIMFFIITTYLLGASVLVFTEGMWVVSFIMIVISIFIVSILAKSECELTEEYLFVQVSIFKVKIYYKNIRKVELKRTIFTSGFALSRDIIRITTTSKWMRFIDVSPELREEVYDELVRRSTTKEISE